MIWPELQSVALLLASRILNTLPEGLLIAVFAWTMLRLLPRQNSGTRFAVWLVALFAVAGLPLIRSGAPLDSFTAAAARPVVQLSSGWAVGLFLAWFSAALLAMLRLAAGLLRLRKLRKSCAVVDCSKLNAAVAQTVASFASARSTQIATSEQVTVPAAMGFFRPLVVLPAWALRELSAEELNIILLHEFAHLRRWDDWSNLAQKIVRAIFVFHPAVWFIDNRLSIEREMACDDIVVSETGNPRGYAKCLISLLEKSFAGRGMALAQAAVHRAQEASLRLAQILDVGRASSKNIWKPALAGVIAISAASLAIAIHAPRLVAFQSAPAMLAGTAPQDLNQPQFSPAVAIAAALQTRSTSLPTPLIRALAVHKSQKLRSTPHVPLPIEAQLIGPPVRAVNAKVNNSELNDQRTTQSQTLLLIRTSPNFDSNSWTWNVYVYRVIWTHPITLELEKAPVAHKT